MKFCTNCGNSMEDDMLFCQQCGTKFKNTNHNELNIIEEKLQKLKTYNLVIDSSTISWEYVYNNSEDAGNIVAKQLEIKEKLKSLVLEIFKNVNDENRNLIEQEVYTYILTMCRRMCNEGAKLFSARDGIQEIFETGKRAVMAEQLSPETLLNDIIMIDKMYIFVSGAQGLSAYELKSILNEHVISNNDKFIQLTKELAQAYNDLIKTEMKRYTDFFVVPSLEHIDDCWNMYEIILNGLSFSIINTLDESGWDLILDTLASNEHKEYTEKFIQRRNSQREELRKKERKIMDKKYWDSHPNEYKLAQEHQKKINKMKKEISILVEDITELKKKKKPIEDERLYIFDCISESNRKISKLQRKIFGKKQAMEEIQKINLEISEMEVKFQNMLSQIQMINEPILQKETEKSKLETETQKLRKEIKKLRNQ